MAPKQLNFITGNKNKLAEVQAILAPTGVDLSNQSVDLLEIQGTIEEISKDKCRRAADTVCNRESQKQVYRRFIKFGFI
jgi:inosine triphosphate pyrophosphatase